MGSYSSPEIIVDILTRLPVESLLRCKYVCKSWCSLISDPHFIESHLSLSSSNNHYAHHRLVFTTESSFGLRTCPLYDVLHDKYTNALDHFPLNQPPDDSAFSIAGFCNGLLCVVMGDTPFIWNPATRRWYRLSGVTKYYCDEFYGFGYDESTDDYKVVLICRLDGYSGPGKDIYKNTVKINSLKSGVWKRLDDFPHDYLLSDSGKFSNGALHWAAIGPSYSWTIISIDLADETYGEILQPAYDEGHTDLTLGVLGKCLCLICNYGVNRADVWMMKVYGVKDSWTKLVSIPYLTDPEGVRFSMPLLVLNDGKVLLCLGSQLIVYDSKNSSFSKIQNFDDDCDVTNTFVESLVSPPIRWKLRKR